MIEFTPRLRNICMICFLIFVFVFLIVNAWMYRGNPIENFENEDTYDCDKIQKIIDEGKFNGNPTNLIPCTPQITPHDGWFSRFDEGDNSNHWSQQDGRMVTTLKTKVKNDAGEEVETNVDGAYILKINDVKNMNGMPIKTDNMTIGFWIYIKRGSHYWKPIIRFGTAENGWWLPERSPGIWLRNWFQNALHVRNVTDGHINAGADFYTESLNHIPLRKPSYVSIVFSEKVYKIYINGVHIQTWDNKHLQKQDKVIDDSDITDVKRAVKHIWLGSWSWDQTFLLKKVEIFPTPLSDDENRLLYCQNKQYASEESEFNTIEGFKGRGRWSINKVSSISQMSGNKNLFHIESSDVQFKSDAEDQSSMDLNQEMENTVPTNGNMIEENKTLPNGVVVHTCKLDKFHFPKLHTSKQLKYVHFESKQKQYLQWTKEFDLTHAPGATFMCWYRPTMTRMFDNKGSWKKYDENNGTWARLFDFGNGSGKENILTALYLKSPTTHVYNENPDNKQRTVYWIHTYIAEGNSWCHFAVTMDRASSTWTFYLNGIPFSHTSGSNGKHYNMLFPADGTRKNQYIGKSNWGNDPYYDGDIGDFRIYKHALSEDEIHKAMNELEDTNIDVNDKFRGFN